MPVVDNGKRKLAKSRIPENPLAVGTRDIASQVASLTKAVSSIELGDIEEVCDGLAALCTKLDAIYECLESMKDKKPPVKYYDVKLDAEGRAARIIPVRE